MLKRLELQGIILLIPAQSNRNQPRASDRHRYPPRHLVEAVIGKLKQFGRGFSRFEKRATHFMPFSRFAAALIWLR